MMLTHHSWRFLLYAAVSSHPARTSVALRLSLLQYSGKSLPKQTHHGPFHSSTLNSYQVSCKDPFSKRTCRTLHHLRRDHGSTEQDNESEQNMREEEVRKKTMDWIQNVVIGLRLCPFAEKPVNISPPGKKAFQILVVQGDDPNIIARTILQEMIRLTVSPESTSVVVTPDFHKTDFHLYLDYLALLEDMFLNDENSEESKLINHQIQIAPFHPKFQFESSSDSSDVTNYTNKSPYPMFHILREEDVSYASKSLGGDSSIVWGRNEDLLREMEDVLGRNIVDRFIEGEKLDGVTSLVSEFDKNRDM